MTRTRSRMLSILFSFALLSPLSLAQVTNFEHLDFLTQPFNVEGQDLLGVWIYAEPSPTEPGAYVGREAPGEGVTDLDDVARAAIAYLWGYENGVVETLDEARGLLDFTMALQAEDGEFFNFVFEDGSINRLGRTSRKGAGFWAARGLWALAEGYRVFQDTDPEYAAQLQEAFLRGVPPFVAKVEPNFGEFETVRGFEVPQWLPDDGADVASILAVALASYLETEEDDTVEDNSVRDLLTMLADGLAAFQYGPPESYPFLAHPSFALNPLEWHAWGSRQTQALAETYEVEPDEDWLESAEAEAGHFFVHLLASQGPVERMSPAVDTFAQIAFGMESIASGYFALADATGKEVYNELGGLMTGWLLGNNELRQPMYEPETGRTFDGLERGIINRNSGAESTITALLALLQAEARPDAAKMLDYVWLEKSDDVMLEVETGTDFGQPPPTEVNAAASGQLTAVLVEGASVGASVTLPESGPYRLYALARAENRPNSLEVFVDDESFMLELPGVDEAQYRMTDVGVLTLAAGEHRVVVNNPAGTPVRADALVFRPAVMEKLYGKEGERLLLLKSWAEEDALAVAEGEGLTEAATVRVFDRFANLVSEEPFAADATLTLPPFGFALVHWTTDAALPDLAGAGARTGPELEAPAAFEEGNFVGLELSSAFNNDAFSSASNPAGNFDNHSGELGATYPIDRSPAGGERFVFEEVPYLFPPTEADANNVAATGQRLSVPPGNYVTLHLLGASEQGNYEAPLTLRYADGEEEVTLALSDWCQQPRYGEAVALDYAQRRGASGAVESLNCRIFAQTVALDGGRELLGISLPDRETMHVFSLTMKRAEP